MQPKANIKLAIRADRSAGVVRAFFSTMDDSDRFQVATVSIELLDADKQLFEDWYQALGRALERQLDRMGLPVLMGRSVVIRQHEKN